MDNHYDVIVVGAGNGGLAAAAALALKGKKVLVLERHNLPGGAASSFVRGRFEIEPSLHEMASVGPEGTVGGTRQIFRDLDAHPNLVVEDQLYRVITEDPKEPIDVSVPAFRGPLLKTLEKEVPGCGPSVEKIFGYMDLLTEALDYVGSGDVKPQVLFKKYGDFFRMVSHSATECLDAIGMPMKARAILATYWPYAGAPLNDLDFMTFLKLIQAYIDYGPGVPEMKSHELSLSIEKSILDHGGDVWYNSPVDKLLVDGGAIYGVSTNGKEVYADHVVVNSNPHAVYGHMMDSTYVPKKAVRKARNKDFGMCMVTMYLGLNKSAEELGIKDYSTFIYQTNDPDEQFRASHGGLGALGYEIVNCLNIMVPDSSPKGTCTLFFTIPVYGSEWGSVRAEDYKKTKNQIAKKMLDYYEQATGIIVHPYIEEISVATPVSMSRYLNTPNGTPYGYQLTMKDSIFLRTIAYKAEKPAVKGLRFCGVHQLVDGYNSGYMTGQSAAEATLKDMEGDA